MFDCKEIDFEDNLLSVFDGPNGYGKTSTFDAVEFLVTGTISRINKSEVILGTTSYDTIFLAKDTKKDVVIKGEFIDKVTNELIIIGIRIRSSSKTGRENNPKSVLNTAETYCLPSFDTPIELWDDYLVDIDESIRFRHKNFGEQNCNQFTLFHYIHQEDRLSYFKQTEKERGDAIETLMGIEKEVAQQKRAEQAQKDLGAKVKALDSQINEIKKKLENRPQSSFQEIEYEPLLNGDYPWDIKDVVFESGNEGLLKKYLTELNALGAYIKYQALHKIYRTIVKWHKVPADMRENTIQAWLLLKQTPCETVVLEEKKQYLSYLERQNRLIDNRNLLDINYSELCERLNINGDLGETLVAEVALLKRSQKSQASMQQSITTMITLRERLHSEAQKLQKTDSCPYCGTIWNNSEELEQHYLDAENTLKGLLDSEGKQYELQYKRFSTMVIEKVFPVLANELSNSKSDLLLSLYCRFNNRETFSGCMAGCDTLMEALKPNHDVENSEDYEKIIKELLLQAAKLETEITDDYLQSNKEFDFEMVAGRYFPDSIVPDTLSEERIETKKKYLNALYMKSFDELGTKLANLTTMKEKADILHGKMKEYAKAMKSAVGKYEEQLIAQIEIPFFIYSSRLLQSYQGGQGVLIRNDGKSIRFVAPGSEHDVLYTMSSGQLSAVLLAFSLAMNKIYVTEGIRTIFIDDPIQCMDDINMISFVELLRGEFSDNQIILSTHEEHFSNYIRYKFKKYNMETQAITLKDA